MSRSTCIAFASSAACCDPSRNYKPWPSLLDQDREEVGENDAPLLSAPAFWVCFIFYATLDHLPFASFYLPCTHFHFFFCSLSMAALYLPFSFLNSHSPMVPFFTQYPGLLSPLSTSGLRADMDKACRPMYSIYWFCVLNLRTSFYFPLHLVERRSSVSYSS